MICKYLKKKQLFENRSRCNFYAHERCLYKERNGQLKAGYNLQIATESKHALAQDIFPKHPTGIRTFIPFLNMIEKNYFELPKYIVADAGYGSEQNYDEVLNVLERIPLITYNQYRKEKKRKFKNDPFKTANWEYNEATDSFICPNNRRLNYIQV